MLRPPVVCCRRSRRARRPSTRWCSIRSNATPPNSACPAACAPRWRTTCSCGPTPPTVSEADRLVHSSTLQTDCLMVGIYSGFHGAARSTNHGTQRLSCSAHGPRSRAPGHPALTPAAAARSLLRARLCSRWRPALSLCLAVSLSICLSSLSLCISISLSLSLSLCMSLLVLVSQATAATCPTRTASTTASGRRLSTESSSRPVRPRATGGGNEDDTNHH